MNSLELLQKEAREQIDSVWGGMSVRFSERDALKRISDEITTHTYETAIKDCLGAFDSSLKAMCSENITVNGEFKYWDSDGYGENPATDKFFPESIRKDVTNALKVLLPNNK